MHTQPTPPPAKQPSVPDAALVRLLAGLFVAIVAALWALQVHRRAFAPPVYPSTAPYTVVQVQTPPAAQPAVLLELPTLPHAPGEDAETACLTLLLAYWGAAPEADGAYVSGTAPPTLVAQAESFAVAGPLGANVAAPAETADAHCLLLGAGAVELPAMALADAADAQLLDDMLAGGRPVALWLGTPAQCLAAPTGAENTAEPGPHCTLLYGFDAENYYVYAPQGGSFVVNRQTLLASHAEAGGHAFVVLPQ